VKFASNLGKYLGFPLMHGKAKKSDFNFILERIQSKLATWKGRLLNRARRVTIARSVINVILISYIQTLWLPRAICNGIDKIIKNFIWSRSDTRRSFNLVNWNTISRPRKSRGLEIRESRLANVVLLGKLV
jgi:hypothetical protein